LSHHRTSVLQLTHPTRSLCMLSPTRSICPLHRRSWSSAVSRPEMLRCGDAQWRDGDGAGAPQRPQHCCCHQIQCHPNSIFFANYTIHRKHSQRTHTHTYEDTHANPAPRSIFEDCAGKSSRLTKSPQTPRCRRERRLPLKAQTPLNPEKFASTGSGTQDLRCYRGSCNH
jgi:hypothetical protein